MGNATPGSANLCFAADSLIRTPTGDVAVADLNIGDLVCTESGVSVAVKWVGRQTAHKLRAGAAMQPVRFRVGALGDGLPNADLTVTADHGMVIDGLVEQPIGMFEAGLHEDGQGIVAEGRVA